VKYLNGHHVFVLFITCIVDLSYITACASYRWISKSEVTLR